MPFDTRLMNPADSQAFVNVTSFRPFFKLLNIITQAVSCSIVPPRCLQERMHFSRLHVWWNCLFAWDTNFSVTIWVWPRICSAKSSHQLATAPWILSWLAELLERNKSSVSVDSAVNWFVHLPPFLFKTPRFNAKLPRNVGCRLSLTFSAWQQPLNSIFPQLCTRTFHSTFFVFSLAEECPLSTRKPLFLHRSWPFRNSKDTLHNFLCPIFVVEHRQPVNLGTIHSNSIGSPLIPINSLQALDREKFFESIFPSCMCFKMLGRLSQTQNWIQVDVYFCLSCSKVDLIRSDNFHSIVEPFRIWNACSKINLFVMSNNVLSSPKVVFFYATKFSL